MHPNLFTHGVGLGSALVLNQSYEPLCVIPVKRAAVLLLTRKAETVTPGDGFLRSETMHIPVPSVVRLNRYVAIPRQVGASPSRRGVFTRDDWRCVYCGSSAETIDHVVPRSRGGTHTWDNVVAACAPCNHRKSDKTLAELGWRLPRVPRPRRAGSSAASAASAAPTRPGRRGCRATGRSAPASHSAPHRTGGARRAGLRTPGGPRPCPMPFAPS
nr:hypothetical protein GCM10025732_21950 [Glycomyces mayteni]